jgi:membrane peptidoglycan carboxypeptidase
MCAYCHVCLVKWYRARSRWNNYCDRMCSAAAIKQNLTAAQKAANNARLRSFTEARRAENPLVHRLLAEALQGREGLSAAEALEFGLKVYRQAWQQGHHAHGNQKRRAALEAT